MAELWTAAHMRNTEQAAMASGQVTGLVLMERAGQGVIDAIFDHWPDFSDRPRKAVVFCGPGNNGGDGYVIARLLADRGWPVDVWGLGKPENLPPDAHRNYEKWVERGAVHPLSETAKPGDLSGYDLCVDAVFGTGLTRAIPDHVADLFTGLAALGEQRPRVVAVDLPTGLCTDSGRVIGQTCARADLTISFHTAKLGHYLDEGPGACGALVVADIGLPPADAAADPDIVTLTDAHLLPGKAGAGHKFSHGHAIVFSGGPGRGGAARLAARGALRVGAGLVTVACPPAALTENAARLDAIMLRDIGDRGAVENLLQDPRINALCIGPGFGLADAAAETLAVVLARQIPTVLDADALTLIARHPDLFDRLHAGCVLTPHGGEFERVFPDIAASLNAPVDVGPAFSRVDAARQAAKRAGCTVLIKGPDTVIAAPSGKTHVNGASYDRAAPWLATAGSGDVLAGVITGLLAQGLAPGQAAATGAWLHTAAAREFGPGLIAEDLPEQVPAVFRALGL